MAPSGRKSSPYSKRGPRPGCGPRPVRGLFGMPPRFVVTGRRPLKGTVRPAGNKNAALPVIAASLLADGPVEIANVPRIRDVETLLELVQFLGATVTWGQGQVTIDPRGLQPKP